MKFSHYTTTKIANLIMNGFTLLDIQKKCPRITIIPSDLQRINETSTLCKYRIIDGIKKRFCNSCGQLKTYNLDNFGKDKHIKSGINGTCKVCIKLKSFNNRIINGKKVRKYNREYYNKNYDKNSETVKKSNEKKLIKNLTEEQIIKRRKQRKLASQKRRKLKFLKKLEDFRKSEKKVLQTEKN